MVLIRQMRTAFKAVVLAAGALLSLVPVVWGTVCCLRAKHSSNTAGGIFFLVSNAELVEVS